MKRSWKILVVLITAVIAMVPMASAVQVTETSKVDTTEVICSVGRETITKELSVATIESIVDMGKSHKDNFLTIYNKYSTEKEVEDAFKNLQPFFVTLIANELTEYTIDELNELFHNIRDRIRKPRYNPFKTKENGGKIQTLGSWNGMPTPVFGNVMCGLFNAGIFAIGFTLGTHTLIPTIGADLATTWFDTGETVTIGFLGITTSTGPEFGLIFGFIGIMIATPIMILGLIFQTGLAGAYVGISPSPI